MDNVWTVSNAETANASVPGSQWSDLAHSSSSEDLNSPVDNTTAHVSYYHLDPSNLCVCV